MDILKIVLMIIFAIDCIALTVIVLMQEVYKIPCDFVYCTGSSVEFKSICIG